MLGSLDMEGKSSKYLTSHDSREPQLGIWIAYDSNSEEDWFYKVAVFLWLCDYALWKMEDGLWLLYTKLMYGLHINDFEL